MPKPEMPVDLFDTLFGDGGYATSISVLLALFIFVLQSRQRRAQDRRNHTLNILLSLESVDRLSSADRRFARWIKTNHRFTNDDISEEDENTIIDLLDFYEMICTSIFMENLDFKVTDHLRGDPMNAAYTVCTGYIRERRKRIGRANLYENLEKFCEYRERSAPFRFAGRILGLRLIRKFI
ncbi:DUF4760 domain-containing protein [Nisaea sp.]|uniref:DUF4760 domain-containing protein n=1 Tax=Nisaea sp. TaxID=2024842 RepID=UPI003B522910